MINRGFFLKKKKKNTTYIAQTLKYKSEKTLRNLTALKATLSVNDFGT